MRAAKDMVTKTIDRLTTDTVATYFKSKIRTLKVSTVIASKNSLPEIGLHIKSLSNFFTVYHRRSHPAHLMCPFHFFQHRRDLGTVPHDLSSRSLWSTPTVNSIATPSVSQ